MTEAMLHRGPDDGGVESLDEGRLGFGHRRLSILDLSPLGHQPMRSANGSCWIVYNGEVYNFREIRAELAALGHAFRSDSDTEVILAAWLQWGPASVERFRGMFAFALWDSRSRSLWLCRDRFGVKPLFYVVRGGRLAFASELRALHAVGLTSRETDPVALADYVQYGYVTAPRTLWAGVRSLRPGSLLRFDAELNSVETVFWSIRDVYDDGQAGALRSELDALPEAALLDRVESALQQAFDYRMVADVPVGLFLSGGIDSSAVAAVLARRSGVHLRTFTIGYGDSEFDETAYAREVATALGAEHTEFIVSPAELLGLFDRTLDLQDEPIGDSSLVPTLMVSELARRHVTVALSADGADELFGGYARYDIVARHVAGLGGARGMLGWLSAEMLDRLPPGLVEAAYQCLRGSHERYAGIRDKLRKFVRMGRARDPFGAYEAAVSEWGLADLRTMGLVPDPGRAEARAAFTAPQCADPRMAFMHFDAARYLPGDLLTKVDRASMAVSLEAREPFLDHELARVAGALPMRWKLRDGKNKYVLRRVLERHLRPGLFDRPKHGFSAPVAEWLRGPLREVVLQELSRESVARVGLLDPAAVEATARSFVAGRGNASPAGIWFLLQLQRWGRRWLHDTPAPVA